MSNTPAQTAVWWKPTFCGCTILSFTSRELMLMMVSYAGRKYETHTVNYFQDVCVRMGLNYTDTRRRNTIQVDGLHGGGGALKAEQKLANQGRFIEFPIWEFCRPEQVKEIYSNAAINELITNLKAMEQKTPGVVQSEWFEEMKCDNLLGAQQGDLPF